MIVAIMTTALSGTAWADEVYKTALFGSGYNESNSSYTSSFVATNGTFAVTATNFNNNSNGWTNSNGLGQIKCGRKNNASVGTIRTNAVIDKAITKVVVTIDAITTNSVNSIKLYTSSNGSTWTEADNFSIAKGAQTVTLSSPTANLYYKVEFDCASGSSNGLVTVSKVEYYYNAGGNPPTPSNPTVSFGTHDNITLEMWDEDLNDLESGDPVAAGTEVFVTATPDFGYNVGTVSAVDADNNQVTLTDNSGNWSFTMPSSNVTINATATENTNIITLWSEDFSSYSADDVPSGGTYGYACTNGGGATKVFAQNNAGGDSPELLVAKSNGTFTAVVPLNNASGNLNLTYKTNAHAMKVSTTTANINIQNANHDDGSISYNTSGTHTVTFTDVTTSMTSITIVFTATSGDNVRLDDIELRGQAQAASVEAPTFSVNGGTYYTAQSVELSCATDGATIYYTTNGDEPTSSSTEYTGAITVSETMTIKAIAVKGSDVSTVSSSTYTIAEKNDVVFTITNKSIAYRETYTVTKGSNSGRDIQTDGTVTVSTNNDAVASVSGMTITAEAVGTAIITLTAAEGDTYKAGSTTITITVTAPTGQTTAPAVPALFNETFDKCDGSGGRDDVYTGNIGTKATTDKLDESWATIGNNGASQCIKLGTGSAAGVVTTSDIALTGNGTLTFSAAGWETGTNTITVSATGATLSGDKEVTLTNSTWNNYTIGITEATGTVAITFSMKRGFLDDVKVVAEGATADPITVKLNTFGYATFCSQYPLDFTGVTDFSAWQITDIDDDNKITFEQVTGSVKGGTGLFLKGEAGATVTIPSADSSNELTGNLLVGTLAPSYFAANQIYGLAGNTFKKNSAGSIKANKAYIPADYITVSGNSVKPFTFIFEEDDATAIEMVNGQSSMVNGPIYNLAGQRISKMQKGINIVNGKKVLK